MNTSESEKEEVIRSYIFATIASKVLFVHCTMYEAAGMENQLRNLLTVYKCGK
jgi:hypothetical protein